MESLPIVDLRLLSQSELTALSLCSSHAFDLRRCDDVVIPKIDRSIFNESAGSRKQTYSRLRLAPRKPDLSSPSSKPRPSPPEPLDSERAENSRIISFFKDLLYSSSSSSPSKALVPVNVEYSDALNAELVGDGGQRKRGRKPKFFAEKNLALAVVKGGKCEGQVEGEGVGDEIDKGLVNKNGVVVDLAQLAMMEDPYGLELRRRTEGKVKPEELLGFMSDLKGQWGSRRKKRKIVDANEFGDVFPDGWKILIAMKKRAGQAWVFCRRYISPSGRYFVSCKEVSCYLLSLTNPKDLKQQSSVQCIEDSLVEGKFTSGNSNDHENQQRQIYSSHTIDQEKQMVLYVPPGEVKAVSALICHKCSTPFSGKDGLLNHLLSCHKRKRRKSGAPVEDDVMFKAGKYECQFCERTFHERTVYFGHVGIHVKNYAKSIGASPIVAPKQKVSDRIYIREAPVTFPGTSVSVGINTESVTAGLNVQASCEPNSTDCKLKVSSDGETLSDYCDYDKNDPSLNSESNLEAAENEKDSTDESSDKKTGIFHLSDKKVGDADKFANVSGLKHDLCDSDDKVFSVNESDGVCRDSSDVSAIECAGPGISSYAAVPGGNAGTNLPDDNRRLHIENNCDVVAVRTLKTEATASEDGLPTTNKMNPVCNHVVVDRALSNENEEYSCDDEELKDGSSDDFMVDSSGGCHETLMDAANGIQHNGNLEECSAVSHNEEKICGTIDNKTDYMESPLVDCIVERDSETCSPSRGQCTNGVQDNNKKFSNELLNDAEVGVCSLEKGEVIIDTKHCIDQERQSESTMFLVSKNYDPSYFHNDSEKVTSVTVMEPQGTGGSQALLTCNTEDASSTRGISCKIDREHRRDELTNSDNLLFMSSITDRPLDADVMTDNKQEKLSAACSQVPSGSGKTHNSNTSDVLQDYNSFVDNNQELNPKSILSGFSIKEHINDVAIHNVSTSSAGATAVVLPELAKDRNSQADKLILDLDSMTDEISARFSNSIEHETVAEGSLSFSLLTEQIGVGENQTRGYVDRELEQERGSDNSSLNLGGFQQSCDVGYSLNKVCMNEQRYVVQRNGTEFYRRSNDAEQNISRGNILNSGNFQQHCDTRYNLNKFHPNQQSFSEQHNQAVAYNASDGAKQERVAYGNALSLASVQQTCDTRYSLEKDDTQQIWESGYSLNKGYIETVQGIKLDGLEHSRDRHPMIGFGDSNSRPLQGAATEFIWGTTEGNIQSGGFVDSSSSRGQSSGSFQAFDFLSDKGGNGMYTSNEKYDMSSFEGLRSTNVEPMEFSFLTTQDSNVQLEDPKVLPYSGELDQGFGSSVWNPKGNSLPNIMSAHVVSTLCVWCGNEFPQDSLSCEIQAGSIGYLCPTCKARMSGQYM